VGGAPFKNGVETCLEKYKRGRLRGQVCKCFDQWTSPWLAGAAFRGLKKGPQGGPFFGWGERRLSSCHGPTAFTPSLDRGSAAAEDPEKFLNPFTLPPPLRIEGPRNVGPPAAAANQPRAFALRGHVSKAEAQNGQTSRHRRLVSLCPHQTTATRLPALSGDG